MKPNERRARHIDSPARRRAPRKHPSPKTKPASKKQYRDELQVQYRRGVLDGYLAGFEACRALENGMDAGQVKLLADVLADLGRTR
jgi:hypothetical protein